jgi:hypothetical protein
MEHYNSFFSSTWRLGKARESKEKPFGFLVLQSEKPISQQDRGLSQPPSAGQPFPPPAPPPHLKKREYFSLFTVHRRMTSYNGKQVRTTIWKNPVLPSNLSGDSSILIGLKLQNLAEGFLLTNARKKKVCLLNVLVFNIKIPVITFSY